MARGRGLALAAALVTLLVPRRFGYHLMDLGGALSYFCLRRYRQAVLANVSRVLGLPTSDPRVRRAARLAFQTSARNFWDLCSLPHTRPNRLLQRIDMAPHGWMTLQEVVRRGRGVILVTGHLGAFDYAGQLVLLVQTRPLIPTAQTTTGRIFHAVTWLRRSWGALVEPATAGMLRRMITYLRQGGVVGLISDRDITLTGRPVCFFGETTTLPVGSIRLALETGAALVTFFCPRVGDRYHLFVEEVLLERTGHREQDLDQNLKRLAAVLERYIRAWPEQWVLFERIWPEEHRVVPRGRRFWLARRSGQGEVG